MHHWVGFHGFLLTTLPLISLATAQQSCTLNPTPTNSIQTSLAPGYTAQVVATGLTAPRSLEFDSSGNLLVLEQARGLSSHVLQDNGGVCVTFQSSKDLILNSNLSHGLALSADQRTVYVSDSDAVYAYGYDASTSSITSNATIFVTGMNNSDHTTRTILYPRTVSGLLVISRGSGGNLDIGAATESTGISQIKAFNLTGVPDGGYNFANDGIVMGWGLRNDVGIVEHPTTGGLWSVENSYDQLMRDGQDVHENNPGEELNYLGLLSSLPTTSNLTSSMTSPTGSSYGYPYCFAAWEPSALPNNANITVGTQFAQATSNDSLCTDATPPRLTFQAHMAPLDIKFNDTSSNGSTAWISFHGSWDRTMPAGYMVGTVAYGGDGEPVAPSTSNTSLTPVFSNVNNSRCPGNCFRPVGLAFHTSGRLFVASDANGEVYVLQRTSEAAATNGSSGGSSATTSGTPAASSSAPASGAEKLEVLRWPVVLVVLGAITAMFT